MISSVQWCDLIFNALVTLAASSTWNTPEGDSHWPVLVHHAPVNWPLFLHEFVTECSSFFTPSHESYSLFLLSIIQIFKKHHKISKKYLKPPGISTQEILGNQHQMMTLFLQEFVTDNLLIWFVCSRTSATFNVSSPWVNIHLTLTLTLILNPKPLP